MKKIFLLLLALCIATTLSAKSRIITENLPSKVLGREVAVNVYIPSGFDESARHYPALYLLHGLYGTNKDWEQAGGLKIVLDELTGTGEAVEMIVIMPCAGHPDVNHVQNGYFNVPGNAYEDFFFGELIPAMESKFRCGGSKGQRAISGLSMGGGGSVVYSQRHPDMFSSCYSMSGWLHQVRPEAKTEADKEDKLFITRQSVYEHSANTFLENASAESLEALRGVKWFVDCGDDDYLLGVNTRFYFLMREKKVPCEFRVRNGTHNWEYWHTALRLSLPFASRNFENR